MQAVFPARRGDVDLRVVLAASEASPLRSLAKTLTPEGFLVSAVAASEDGAVAAAIADLPDIFLLASDVQGSPLRTAGRVADAVPWAKVVVVVDRVDDDDCLAYLLAGVAGYLVDEGDPTVLASALRDAAAGLAVVPRTAQRRLLDALR